MSSLYLRVYLYGYDGNPMPRFLRKLIAGSEIHRAWLVGYKGFFEEDGIRFGPANRYPRYLILADDP